MPILSRSGMLRSLRQRGLIATNVLILSELAGAMFKGAKETGRKILFKLQSGLQPERFLKPVVDYFGRTRPLRGKALLIYRTLPFHLAPDHPVFNFHQSMIQSRLIGGALDRLGFSLDVVDYSRSKVPRDCLYDIVVCHNGEEDPSAAQYKDALKIYLASGTEHRAHNDRQKLRLEAFETRMGHHNIELQWDTENMPWTEQSDAIFCFGNEKVADSWRERFRCPVYPFQNTALKQLNDIQRSWRSPSNHFLFLGSRQQLAKGLDLLLEAFADGGDLHLHVCGHYLRDRGFCRAYAKQLFHTPNIHSHGWVDVTSRRFMKIAAQCSFTISATCAEGSPGSITNAMRLGMIPIVSPEAGLDAGSGVIILNDLSIGGIRSMVRDCAWRSAEELAGLSHAAVQRAKVDFTEAAFGERWFQMLSTVLGGSNYQASRDR